MSTQSHQKEFFKSSRAKTLTIAVVGIVALSGAGALAGALVDAEAGNLGTEYGVGLDSSGAPIPTSGLTSGAHRGQISSSSSPSPFGGETSPAPAPSPTDGTGTDTGGVPSAVLDGGSVTIPLPAPWAGDVDPNGAWGSFFNGEGDWVYAEVAFADPTVNDAQGLLTANAQLFFPPEYYTQLEFGDITVQGPAGTLLGIAYAPYRALWVDPQSSFPLFGNIWLGLRQDGKVLVMTAESTPELRFDEGFWRPLVDGAFTSFAYPAG